jgi:hypothetical protein
MTILETRADEQTQEGDEGDIVHVVCCVTESSDYTVEQTLCGIPLDDDSPVNYDVDMDCEGCEALCDSGFCPIFGQCPSE